MDHDDFRRLALSLPHTEEKSHFAHPDFRVRNRIFASLKDDLHGVIKLTPDEQRVMVDAEPSIFAPVKGGWGRQGWTEMALSATDAVTALGALRTAWRNVAPATLRKALDSAEQRNPGAKLQVRASRKW
ncbi:MAG: MmcQ/YjbR family DNA-binding protein [Rhizobiaceae bacterium]